MLGFDPIFPRASENAFITRNLITGYFYQPIVDKGGFESDRIVFFGRYTQLKISTIL
tara:strand:+ start:973 stop:1143 length:171 start_codon:yes stop_codon:yes gene_type:complete